MKSLFNYRNIYTIKNKQILFKISVYIFILISCFGCIDGGLGNIDPKTKLTGWNAKISRNNNSIIDINTTDCNELSGFNDPVNNQVVIRGIDVQSQYQFLMGLYYNTITELPGTDLRCLFETSGAPSFVITVIDNYRNQYQSYSGTFRLTSFDTKTGLASASFSFNARKLDNDGNQIGASISFSGSFQNIPIYPNDVAATNCTNMDPGGISNGSATTPGGNGNTGNGSTSVLLENTTFTPINITFNGTNSTIEVGKSQAITGKAGTQATFTAKTSGKTSSGTIVGLELVWNNVTVNFPSTGSVTIPLQISKDYFFAYVKNNSVRNIEKVIVNYKLQSQTTENLSIPNDQKLYRLGYYKAYSNSNVRFENTTTNWYWQFDSDKLQLPFTVNQSVTLTTN